MVKTIIFYYDYNDVNGGDDIVVGADNGGYEEENKVESYLDDINSRDSSDDLSECDDVMETNIMNIIITIRIIIISSSSFYSGGSGMK